MKIEFLIPNMSCKHCVNRIEKVLSEYRAISSLHVDLTKKQVHFELSDASLLDVIKATLANAHYPVI
ncbi:MAG: cation transporter [Bacilli bacterium]|nr:cation transporter [Bacilli bacterium]